MLSTILKSSTATKVSIAIMEAFVVMKIYISNELLEQKYINNMVYKLDERVSLLERTFLSLILLVMNYSLMDKYGMHIHSC